MRGPGDPAPLSSGLCHPQSHQTATPSRTSLLHSGRKQPGDRAVTVWSQSFPSSRHPATCNSLVNLIPAAGQTRKWGGLELNPGGEVEGGHGASSQAGGAGACQLRSGPLYVGVTQSSMGITGPPAPAYPMPWPYKAKDISQETLPLGERH